MCWLEKGKLVKWQTLEWPETCNRKRFTKRRQRYFTAPFNNMRNLKFKSSPTVAFFAAINYNSNICTLATKGPWKTQTYKNNKMDQNQPITAKNVTFSLRVNGPWKTETHIMDQNPSIIAKNVTFWPGWPQFLRFLILPLRWLTAAKTELNRWWRFEFQFPHVIEKRNNTEQNKSWWTLLFCNSRVAVLRTLSLTSYTFGDWKPIQETNIIPRKSISINNRLMFRRWRIESCLNLL